MCLSVLHLHFVQFALRGMCVNTTRTWGPTGQIVVNCMKLTLNSVWSQGKWINMQHMSYMSYKLLAWRFYELEIIGMSSATCQESIWLHRQHRGSWLCPTGTWQGQGQRRARQDHGIVMAVLHELRAFQSCQTNIFSQWQIWHGQSDNFSIPSPWQAFVLLHLLSKGEKGGKGNHWHAGNMFLDLHPQSTIWSVCILCREMPTQIWKTNHHRDALSIWDFWDTEFPEHVYLRREFVSPESCNFL